MGEISGPWKMTAIGMALVLVTALVGGFVLGYWTGGKPGPVVSPDASARQAPSAPAAPRPPQAAPVPAVASPPKVASPPVEPPRPKTIATTPAPPEPVAPAPTTRNAARLPDAKRPRMEPAPAPAVKPRTAALGPSAADIEACSRFASAQMDGQDKTAEDSQERKEGGAFREAYVSCLQSRGFKKPRGDD